MSNLYAQAAPWFLYVILAGIAGLIAWGMVREIRTARRKDREEKTDRHIRAKLMEYGIILVVGTVAYIAVGQLKDGPLQGVSRAIWGTPREAATSDSPFYGDSK